MERFAALRKAAVPLLLDGLIDGTLGEGNFSLRRLRERFADRQISVIPTRAGRLSCDARTGMAFDTIRFGDYVERLERGDDLGAYLVAPGDPWLPELSEDLGGPPIYCRDASWRNTRFWLGAPHTSTPLHRDMAENIFFQILGRKRFFLYPPAASPWLYSNAFRSALPNYSRFDPETPDYERFPLSREVQPVEVILQPGDALYLPSRWWHQVRSLDVSASFNFWFANGALASIVNAAELVKRLRSLEIYGLQTRLDRSPPHALSRRTRP